MDKNKHRPPPPKKREIHRLSTMDLKIYCLQRNPRLWLDSWQSLKSFAKIISVISISESVFQTHRHLDCILYRLFSLESRHDDEPGACQLREVQHLHLQCRGQHRLVRQLHGATHPPGHEGQVCRLKKKTDHRNELNVTIHRLLFFLESWSTKKVSFLKGTVSRDEFGFWWHVWLVLGLNRVRSQFLNFLVVQMILFIYRG
jgi:hypothetical protein